MKKGTILQSALCALTAIILVSGISQAGFLASSQNTGAAVNGSANYNFSGNGNLLSGSIEYAVYDTQAANYGGEFSAAVGDSAGQYIYVYQIFNGDGLTNENVHFFGITGMEDASLYAIDTSGYVDADEANAAYVDAGDAYFASAEGRKDGDGVTEQTDITKITYDFEGALGKGETSYFLIFTSDSGWVSYSSGGSGGDSSSTKNQYFIGGETLGGGNYDDDSVPEPATLAIMGLGGLILSRRKK